MNPGDNKSKLLANQSFRHFNWLQQQLVNKVGFVANFVDNPIEISGGQIVGLYMGAMQGTLVPRH